MLHAPAAATAGCCLFGQTSSVRNCIQFIIFHTGLQGVSGLISGSHEALCRLGFPTKKVPCLSLYAIKAGDFPVLIRFLPFHHFWSGSPGVHRP